MDRLDELMKDALIAKSRTTRFNDSPDSISVRVIEEAAELFKISKYLTPAQKADSVHYRFSERMLEDI